MHCRSSTYQIRYLNLGGPEMFKAAHCIRKSRSEGVTIITHARFRHTEPVYETVGHHIVATAVPTYREFT